MKDVTSFDHGVTMNLVDVELHLTKNIIQPPSFFFYYFGIFAYCGTTYHSYMSGHLESPTKTHTINIKTTW